MECSVFPDTIPDMEIKENESLKDKTTLHIGGSARYFISTEDIEEAAKFAQEQKLPIFVLGGGSNIVLPDEELEAVVISPSNTGRKVLSEDEKSVVVRLGAGENLDSCIQYTVDQGWWGLENLSFVPGTVAGLAVQNVGAYGVEAKECIESVEVFDLKEEKYRILTNKECYFEYRKSIFNTEEKGRYIITHVAVRLSTVLNPILTYRGVAERVQNTTQQHIRDTIISIRKEKGLDPERVWSAGSFFKNEEAKDISNLPEEIQDKCFKTDLGYKVPSGALIEHAGLKGFCVGDACVSQTQANMLINTKNASQKDMMGLYEHVCCTVKSFYGIELTHEPEFVSNFY